MKAIVIGGGLGGLATALRLSAGGWHVTVCEAGASFGGKMNRWREGGYCFDTGPSLLTLPEIFEDLYSAAGERIEEHLQLVHVDPHAEYRFPDGARIVCPASTGQWKDEIRRVEPRDVAGFEKVHALGRKIYQLSKLTFFRRSPRTPPSWRDLTALRYLPIPRGWGNYERTVAHFLRSPYLRQIYNRYPTYVGSSPYASPATLLVIPFIEREFGAWYVRGGLYEVIESLVRLALARGITLLSNSRVTAVERNGARASGVYLENGARLGADVVVMNGDAATVAGLLRMPARNRTASRSLSGFVMMLGVRPRPASLGHHTVLFSSGYREEFDDLFARRQFPREPTLYISAPGANDDSVSPPGGDALFIMANAPADGENWTPSHVEAASRAVHAKLSASGLELGRPDVSGVFDPGRFAQQYLAPGGAIYGTHSHGWKHAFFRPPNRSPDLAGLYFAGGSTHPGGGTPTVLMSAKITAEMIESDARS